MSVILETKTIGLVNIVRRTWRTVITSYVNQPVLVTAYREELTCAEDGTILLQNQGQSAGVINRTLNDVVASGQTVTLTDGTVLTANQVGEAVERFIEAWDVEDRPPPAPVEPEPEPAP